MYELWNIKEKEKQRENDVQKREFGRERRMYEKVSKKREKDVKTGRNKGREVCIEREMRTRRSLGVKRNNEGGERRTKNRKKERKSEHTEGKMGDSRSMRKGKK